MAAKNFSVFMSQTRPTRLRLALQAQPSILHAKQDATRHAALRCLLRVTADDIRQRYSAPVSGILTPQRVSNLRIVTKL